MAECCVFIYCFFALLFLFLFIYLFIYLFLFHIPMTIKKFSHAFIHLCTYFIPNVSFVSFSPVIHTSLSIGGYLEKLARDSIELLYIFRSAALWKTHSLNWLYSCVRKTYRSDAPMLKNAQVRRTSAVKRTGWSSNKCVRENAHTGSVIDACVKRTVWRTGAGNAHVKLAIGACVQPTGWTNISCVRKTHKSDARVLKTTHSIVHKFNSIS